MSMTVGFVNAGLAALLFVTLELLHISPVRRNQTAVAGKAFRLVEELALFTITDRS